MNNAVRFCPKWLTTENKRRARVYEITAEGRKRLRAEEERWMTFNAASITVSKSGAGVRHAHGFQPVPPQRERFGLA